MCVGVFVLEENVKLFEKSHFFLHCRQTNIHIKHLESHLKHIAQDKSASLFLVLRNGESTTWLKKFKKKKRKRKY